MRACFCRRRSNAACVWFSCSQITILAFAILTIGSATGYAAAIAQEGIAIIGVSTGIGPALGTEYAHAGFATNVNDGDINSSVDTFNSPGPPGNSSYVGVVFPDLRPDQIVSLTLDVAAFFDGGWFGPNGTGPGATGTLNSTHLK